MIARSLIAAFFILAVTVVFDNAAAKSLDEAVDAMRTGDFAEAYCIMRPLAD